MNPVNFEKLKPFQSEFEELGYRWKDGELDKIQIMNSNIWLHTDGNIIHLFPGLDIFVYKTIEENFISKVIISSDVYRNAYPHSYHYHKNLYPLISYKYRCLDAEPLILEGPNNPKKYLDGTYPDWEKNIFMTIKYINII